MVTDQYAEIQDDRRVFVPELFEQHIRGITPDEERREDLRAYMSEYQKLPAETKGELRRLFSVGLNPLNREAFDVFYDTVGNF